MGKQISYMTLIDHVPRAPQLVTTTYAQVHCKYKMFMYRLYHEVEVSTGFTHRGPEVEVSTGFTHRGPEARGCVNRVETSTS